MSSEGSDAEGMDSSAMYMVSLGEIYQHIFT